MGTFISCDNVLTPDLDRLLIYGPTCTPHPDPVGLDPPEKAGGTRQELELLALALGDLPEKYRAVFLLARCEGFTQREIAAQLNINESTVEKQIAKGMQHCRAGLERGYVGNRSRLS